MDVKTEVEGLVELTLDVLCAPPKNKLWVAAPVPTVEVTDDVGLVVVDVVTLNVNVPLETVLTEAVVEGLPNTVCFIIEGIVSVGVEVDVTSVILRTELV